MSKEQATIETMNLIVQTKLFVMLNKEIKNVILLFKKMRNLLVLTQKRMVLL